MNESEIEIPNPVSLSQVAQLFHYSKSTVYGWRHDRRFPRPDSKRRYDIFKIGAFAELQALEKMDATEFRESELARADRLEELLNSGRLEGLEKNLRNVISKIRRADPEAARAEAIAELEAGLAEADAAQAAATSAVGR